MSKTNRAELAAAFLVARQYLGETHIDTENTREFICHCLELAEGRHKITEVVCEAARRIVEGRLLPRLHRDTESIERQQANASGLPRRVERVEQGQERQSPADS